MEKKKESKIIMEEFDRRKVSTELSKLNLKFSKVILLNRKEISHFNLRLWKNMEKKKIGEQQSQIGDSNAISSMASSYTLDIIEMEKKERIENHRGGI